MKKQFFFLCSIFNFFIYAKVDTNIFIDNSFSREIEHSIFKVHRAKAKYSVTSNKRLVVFITGYNNGAWVEKTLDSIRTQRYQNFRILYIDDCSSDGTSEIVKSYIKKHHLSDRCTFICNDVRKRKMANLYHGFYLCDDDEIVVFIDGDDWLAHDRVFDRIVAEYQDEQTWMTYGSYCNVPKIEADRWGVDRNGSCNYIPEDIFKKRAYRKHSFIFMHLRTCYGWLLKQIKLQDLIAQKVSGFIGDFYPASNDLATFFPVVEMAHGHVQYIKELLYMRNVYSELVGFKVDRKPQVSSAFEIRKKKSYLPIKKPIKRNLEQYRKCNVDIILLVDDATIDVTFAIAQIQKNITSYEHIFVLYDRSVIDKKYIQGFTSKKDKIISLGYVPGTQKSYRTILQILLGYAKNNYIAVVRPEYLFAGKIDCSKYIYWLERTYADRAVSDEYSNEKRVIISDGVTAALQEGNHDKCYISVYKKNILQKLSCKKESNLTLYIAY